MAEPAYACSIPSIHDDLPLDCRIYHPKDLHHVLYSSGDSSKAVKGAVVAHPYAPLGGCYDDPIVLSVTETLLRQGFIVGTFNFRGASDSSGSSTLTGFAEQQDFSSCIGFICYYLHELRPTDGFSPLEPIPSAGNVQTLSSNFTSVDLLLAGYSYGSLVLARLPPVSSTLQQFSSAEHGTAAAEIILRSQTLAKQTKSTLEAMHGAASPRGRQTTANNAPTNSTKRTGASPMIFGGEETNPSARRSSRSVDIVRKSADMPHRIRAHMRRSSTPRVVSGTENEDGAMPTVSRDLPSASLRYLFISPVLLPFTHVLSPPGAPSFMPGARKQATPDRHAFLQHPTFVIFGSSDGFTAGSRTKVWAEKMSIESSSSLEWNQIEGAGHFWREMGALEELQKTIVAWVKGSVANV